MAQITINEISQNYSFVTGNASYCSVALPITASWGPGYFAPATLGASDEDVLESVVWERFPATQKGLESFVSTYRGASSNYRSANDYSYQIAMTLISSGYDVYTCRVCPGSAAQAEAVVFEDTSTGAKNEFAIFAKYPGSFGNNLAVKLNKIAKSVNGVNYDYWNAVVYVVDSNGARTAVENLIFRFDVVDIDDNILNVTEISSKFIDIKNISMNDSVKPDVQGADYSLSGGSDRAADAATASAAISNAVNSACERYGITLADIATVDYINELNNLATVIDDKAANKLAYCEWIYLAATKVYDLLADKLSYNPNRIISPWDDQNASVFTENTIKFAISPIHAKLMEVAAKSRCATALIDVPKSLPRNRVHDTDVTNPGYAQLLSNLGPGVDGLYTTHSALFAPWGQYTFVGMSKQSPCPPSIMFLLIQRSMITNQSLQYEWAMPTTRKHTVSIGKLDYSLPKQMLDQWQSGEGVCVNVITAIPDLGTGIWGNSTLYNLPPATYQALWNLSTRFLVNAVENVVYRAGLGITFQYSNQEAYSRFYAAVTPTLDMMKNVGAIEAYRVQMSADINNLDSVNANSVIGKIYLVINGVINDITVDLIALPSGTDLAAL